MQRPSVLTEHVSPNLTGFFAQPCTGHEIENHEVIQPLEGDQGQVSGPQMPPPGNGNEIENPNWQV